MAEAFTTENFEAEVLQSKIPVVVDFWATWCGPCKMFGPIIEDFSRETQGKVKVGKVDIDQEMALAEQFGIMSVPTVLVFKNGDVTNKSIGVVSKQVLEELVGLSS